MKRKIFNIPAITMIGLAGYLLMAACTNEQEVGASQPLVVAASIRPLTRAEDKLAFVSGDQIKIWKKNAESANKIYKYADNRWLPATTDTITTTGNEIFLASFPTTFSAILSDQRSPDNYAKSNQLITGERTAIGNRVEFEFSPAAAKITIKINYATNDPHVAGDVTVTGNNLLSRSSGQNNTVTLLPVATSGYTSHTYAGIISAGAQGYTIAVNSKIGTSAAGTPDQKTYKETKQTLAAGTNYIYNFTSTNDLILNGVTVQPFIGTGTDTEVGDAT